MNTIIDMVTFVLSNKQGKLGFSIDETFVELAKSEVIFLDGSIFLSETDGEVEGVTIYLNSKIQRTCWSLENVATSKRVVLLRMSGSVGVGAIGSMEMGVGAIGIEGEGGTPQEVLDTFASMLYSRIHTPCLTEEEVRFLDIISEVNAL